MMNEVGAHCKAHNRDSIGICFVGNFDLIPVSAAQWEMGVKLVRSLCDIYHIPFSEIHGHREFDTKTCPGMQFNGGKFIKDVIALRAVT